MRAAVTGGTGFVGAALIERLLDEGWEVTALVRDPSRMKTSGDINAVEGDLESQTALDDLARHTDVFFHLAGVTHARNDDEYRSVNVEGAVRAAKAASSAQTRFVHVSSMSARLPRVSPYAASKYESEGAIADASDTGAWIALRLPAIYGPGDTATLPYFKMIKSGLALEPRTREIARASLLHVDDAAAAIIAAADAPAGRVYEVGDDSEIGRSWAEIGLLLGEALGKKPVRVRIPRPVIALYHGAVRAMERGQSGRPSVRTGQIDEFFHPDWVARENLLSDACAWRAQTPLKEGFAKTVRWYQENGLL